MLKFHSRFVLIRIYQAAHSLIAGQVMTRGKEDAKKKGYQGVVHEEGVVPEENKR